LGRAALERLVGTTVLDPGPASTPNLHLYAHSLCSDPDGFALVVVNTDRTATRELIMPTASERYTLSASQLLDTTVELNGAQLRLGANGELPSLAGLQTPPGQVSLAPASITFLAVPPILAPRALAETRQTTGSDRVVRRI
jgi:hypothetical protein